VGGHGLEHLGVTPFLPAPCAQIPVSRTGTTGPLLSRYWGVAGATLRSWPMPHMSGFYGSQTKPAVVPLERESVKIAVYRT
jgi:hypothetical protein